MPFGLMLLIVENVGSSVNGSMVIRSIAPGICPHAKEHFASFKRRPGSTCTRKHPLVVPQHHFKVRADVDHQRDLFVLVHAAGKDIRYNIAADKVTDCPGTQRARSYG